jgi:hypothetical protein
MLSSSWTIDSQRFPTAARQAWIAPLLLTPAEQWFACSRSNLFERFVKLSDRSRLEILSRLRTPGMCERLRASAIAH